MVYADSTALVAGTSGKIAAQKSIFHNGRTYKDPLDQLYRDILDGTK